MSPKTKGQLWRLSVLGQMSKSALQQAVQEILSRAITSGWAGCMFLTHPLAQRRGCEFQRWMVQWDCMEGHSQFTWSLALMYYLAAQNKGQSQALPPYVAPDWIRTSTPGKAQALNLPRMPIPPPGLARYYTATT
jgi:hypothetical protein